VEVGSDAFNGGHDPNGNAGSDHRIFDGRSGGFVLEEGFDRGAHGEKINGRQFSFSCSQQLNPVLGSIKRA